MGLRRHPSMNFEMTRGVAAAAPYGAMRRRRCSAKDLRIVVFVGEQPGDQEDIAGKPFVGPAGKVFDEILAEAGVDRQKTYVTNAVKHFKFEPRGKRRDLFQTERGRDPGLSLVARRGTGLNHAGRCGGLGRDRSFVVAWQGSADNEDARTSHQARRWAARFPTVHPSFILRIPDPADKEAERQRFLEDMRAVKELAA